MVILLLGGSASGKSQWAEGLAAVPSSTLQLWRRRTGNPAAG